MDRSRIAAAVAAAGRVLVAVPDPAGLAARATDEITLVVLDLGRPGVLDALLALASVSSVGFASHVDHELLRRARSAGCGRVLARSAFFSNLAGLLAGDPGGDAAEPVAGEAVDGS
jgi:hypothetical protein